MIDGKTVVAVTLARGGSKGIPKKNITSINGRPLIDYTFEQARKSKYIDHYCVSTDDKEIVSICRKHNVKVIDRPSELASDTAKSSDALLHAVSYCPYDYVVELMATNPFKIAEDIDGCIEKLHDRKADSVVAVKRIYDQHPSRVKYLDENDVMQDFYPEEIESRRQDLRPKAYIRNGSIYAMTRDFLIKEKVRYNKNSLAYVMPDKRTVNIDEPEDLELAEIRMKRICE